MDWKTKQSWLSRNPVTVAKQIDYIFEQLWGKVILSGANPIGWEILNYDRRIEMHIVEQNTFMQLFTSKVLPDLMLILMKRLPISLTNVQFLILILNQNFYYNLVMSRKQHKHTRTCKKNKSAACRFFYPWPPWNKTSKNFYCHLQGAHKIIMFMKMTLWNCFFNIIGLSFLFIIVAMI